MTQVQILQQTEMITTRGSRNCTLVFSELGRIIWTLTQVQILQQTDMMTTRGSRYCTLDLSKLGRIIWTLTQVQILQQTDMMTTRGSRYCTLDLSKLGRIIWTLTQVQILQQTDMMTTKGSRNCTRVENNVYLHTGKGNLLSRMPIFYFVYYNGGDYQPFSTKNTEQTTFWNMRILLIMNSESLCI